MEPSRFGLSLGDRALLKIMGPANLGEFLRERETEYNEWRKKQFSNDNFPLLIIEQMVKRAGGEFNVEFERFQRRNTFNTLQEKIK